MALFLNQTFTLPFLCCFGEWDASVCEQHLRIDGGTAGKVLPRGQSGVPLMVWKEKAKEGGNHTFSPSCWAECCFWNFLSGIIRGADSFFFFHWFPVTLFIVHELFLWNSPAAVADIVPSQPDLFDISHTKKGGSWRLCINSDPLRGWGLNSEQRFTAVHVGAYLEELFVILALFWPCFLSQNALLLPSGCCWICLWSSRGFFPLPRLPR